MKKNQKTIAPASLTILFVYLLILIVPHQFAAAESPCNNPNYFPHPKIELPQIFFSQNIQKIKDDLRPFETINATLVKNLREKIDAVNSNLLNTIGNWQNLIKKICSNQNTKSNLEQYIPELNEKFVQYTRDFASDIDKVSKLKNDNFVPDGTKILTGFTNFLEKISEANKLIFPMIRLVFAKKIDQDSLQRLNAVLPDTKGNGLSLVPGFISTTITREKIAVFAPGLFGGEASPEGYKKITPIGLIYAIRDYLFKIANELFILLVVIGGIFYILGALNQGYLQKGKDWIKYAILGYVILLIASAIISVLGFLFGAPK